MIAMLNMAADSLPPLGEIARELKIPLPASTQWEIVAETAEVLAPVYEELIHQIAQGEVLHNDDTTMTILELGRDGPKEKEEDDDESQESEKWKQRKGVFTSGIGIDARGQRIALFFTDASTRERTWPLCWPDGRSTLGLQYKCVMRWRAISPSRYRSS